MPHDPVVGATAGTAQAELGIRAWLVLLLAVTSGLSVASIYYAQPLLEAIRADVGMSLVAAGLVVTVSQIGYAAGLLFLVPLGDLLERRGLVLGLVCGIGIGLCAMGFAGSPGLVLLAATGLGVLSVAAQVVVAFAASLASAETRGRVVGVVMSGLLLGVLLARTVAGAVAGAFGWRMVFWAAAAAMFGLAGVLRVALPRYPGVAGLGYGALLRSVGELIVTEPVLRRRSLFGALSFGGFSVLWTPLSFLLSGPPFGYGAAAIGLFGLAGLAGALAASTAGRLADRGLGHATTGVTAALLVLAWIPLCLGQTSVVLLVAGVVVLDLAAQGLHISNQSEIYRLRPDARSRVTAAYMCCFFLGGIVGSTLSALAYARFGWTGVSLVGAAFGLAAFCLWLTGRRA